MSDYPNHRERAEMVLENLPEGGAGSDMLIEAGIDAEDYQEQMQRIHVMLDSIADNQGLLPDEIQSDVREMQKTAQEMDEWLMAYSAALRKLG